jgi:hypothetical protein
MDCPTSCGGSGNLASDASSGNHSYQAVSYFSSSLSFPRPIGIILCAFNSANLSSNSAAAEL